MSLQCPKCGAEIEQDFGMIPCPQCGSVLSIDFEGQIMVSENLPAYENANPQEGNISQVPTDLNQGAFEAPAVGFVEDDAPDWRIHRVNQPRNQQDRAGGGGGNAVDIGIKLK